MCANIQAFKAATFVQVFVRTSSFAFFCGFPGRNYAIKLWDIKYTLENPRLHITLDHGHKLYDKNVSGNL